MTLRILACNLALAVLIPIRRATGRAHTALVYVEARAARKLDRLKASRARRDWPLFVAFALFLGACGIPAQVRRDINAELRRCEAALDVAYAQSDEAGDAELARCHANLDGIGDR